MRDLTGRIARLRVPLGFMFAVLVVWQCHPTGMSIAYGGLIAGVGEGLRVWAAGHLNKSREVTSSGPYRWLAHPLYAGSSIMGLGLTVASRSLVVAIAIALNLFITLGAAIRSEEAFLREKFGENYAGYRRGGDAGNRTRRFSMAQAIANREHRAVAGLAAAILLLALKAMYDGMFWRTAGTP